MESVRFLVSPCKIWISALNGGFRLVFIQIAAELMFYTRVKWYLHFKQYISHLLHIKKRESIFASYLLLWILLCSVQSTTELTSTRSSRCGQEMATYWPPAAHAEIEIWKRANDSCDDTATVYICVYWAHLQRILVDTWAQRNYTKLIVNSIRNFTSYWRS